MVTAPMMQQGIDVDLPQTTTQAMRLDQEPLVLTVKQRRQDLPRQAGDRAGGARRRSSRAVFESRGDKEFYLRADQEAPYGMVAKAMAAARDAGATKLGIVTEPEG